ncbi:hypothetical protein BDZ89DRAFT_1065926 [Hymenopellis radicata]|nr:hypothetical protein BDZ89DRAFT_1065926 [Hymenopellis radicata]
MQSSIAQNPPFRLEQGPDTVPPDRQASSFSRSSAPSPELSPRPGTYGCRHIATLESVATNTTASPRPLAVDHHQKRRRLNSGWGYATLCDENKDLHARNDELEQEMADAKTTIWVLKQRLGDMESSSIERASARSGAGQQRWCTWDVVLKGASSRAGSIFAYWASSRGSVFVWCRLRVLTASSRVDASSHGGASSYAEDIFAWRELPRVVGIRRIFVRWAIFGWECLRVVAASSCGDIIFVWRSSISRE